MCGEGIFLPRCFRLQNGSEQRQKAYQQLEWSCMIGSLMGSCEVS